MAGRPRKKAEVTTAAEIYLGADGLWHGWVEFPDPLPNGLRDRRHRKGKDENKVKAKVAELEKQRDEKKRPAVGTPVTVESWFTTWLEDIAPFGRDPMSPGTLEDYWSKCRTWIFPSLGKIALDSLTTDDLDRLYKKMRKARPRGRPLADGTILKVHAIIRRGLGVAIPRGKIVSRINVAAIIDNPARPAPPRRDIDTADAPAILAAIEGRPSALRWRVGLAVGPRQGTVLAWRWTFLDLKAGTVDMAWQIQRRTWQHGCDDPVACVAELTPTRCRTEPCRSWDHGCGPQPAPNKPGKCGLAKEWACPSRRTADCRKHLAFECPSLCEKKCAKHAAHCPDKHGGGIVFCRPKQWKDTDRGHIVALPPTLVAELTAHKAAQRRDADLLGDLYENNDLVFCQTNGRPIDATRDRNELKKILEIAGLSHRGTHWFRHFAATYVVEAGEAIEVAQEMLGHADPNLTRRLYATNAKGLTQRGAAATEGLFDGRGATRGATLATPPATDAHEKTPDQKAS